MTTFYVASKTKHAGIWLWFEKKGVPIVSTWIFEAGEGETEDFVELAHRCIEEVKAADVLVLYCQPGDILKGALIEVGVAMSEGKEIRCVGECDSLSKKVFCVHPLWKFYPTLEEAFK